MNRFRTLGTALTLMVGLAAFACDRPAYGAGELPAPTDDLPKAQPGERRTVVLAAGCFWCVEAVFEQMDGVIDVVSGYAGGTAETANYDAVSSGRTKHAEVVQVTYDPSKVTFGQLLRVFFATHDPTTKNRQGPDEGAHYRSAVFYANADEQRVAEAYIRQLNEGPFAKKKVVTTVEPLETFHLAEDYHQDFAKLNPGHGYIRRWVPGKIDKLTTLFPEQVKGATTRPSDR